MPDDTAHLGVINRRESMPSAEEPAGRDVLERLKTLVWQATDSPVLWQEIVIAAIDYAHARTIAALERVGKPIGRE